MLAAIALLIFLLFAFFTSLDWITHHGDVKKVPSVVGRNIEEAEQILKSQGFDVAVQDSVYVDTAARASVIKQSPDADAVVKINRTIYLTINRTEAPLVNMPDLRGFSFLSAQLYLQSLGLKLGDTTYTPDIAKNAVKDQLYNGKTIEPGTKVNMGSAISLILGDGISDNDMDVPDIVGMTFSQAKDYLTTLNISIGAIVPNTDVTDTGNAFVYRQSPATTSSNSAGESTKNKISPGQVVDVWLSVQQPVIDTSGTVPAPNQPQ